ncbi:MAG: adenylate kinase family protein [Planctomycetota bacterium]|jgi:adenylate kinase
MSDRYRSLLLFGAPGVGKGTQGRLLGQIPGINHLATGDMFRSLDKSSELGRRFVEFSSQGLLVPDELTVQLWDQYVKRRITDGEFRPRHDLLVLDGIPRSVSQARMLEDRIEVLGVIHLVAPDIDAMVERMKRRAEREGRHDDADETVIRRRFDVYKAETAPVLDLYDTSLVHEVGAVGSPATVLLEVLGQIVPILEHHFGNPLET